jgi:hypothetical protein
MVAKQTGTSVKNKAHYKRLRNLGVSAKESLQVANASAKTSRKKASQRGAAVSSFDNLKVPSYSAGPRRLASRARSTMNKKQLVRALRTS